MRDVNNQRDSNGVSYARKAMIRPGMFLNLNGCWEKTQLTSELQEIIRSHRNHFGGLEVGNGDLVYVTLYLTTPNVCIINFYRTHLMSVTI